MGTIFLSFFFKVSAPEFPKYLAWVAKIEALTLFVLNNLAVSIVFAEKK